MPATAQPTSAAATEHGQQAPLLQSTETYALPFIPEAANNSMGKRLHFGRQYSSDEAGDGPPSTYCVFLLGSPADMDEFVCQLYPDMPEWDNELLEIASRMCDLYRTIRRLVTTGVIGRGRHDPHLSLIHI